MSILVKTQKGNNWTLVACAMLGAASFVLIYGVSTLNVTNEAWIWPAVPEGDVVQNYAGWMAYRHSPWQFPLAYTNAICWPDGTLITYMDANPLLSVLLKLFSPVLPQTFVVYGWFTLVCYMLQGLAAGFLGQLFCQKRWQIFLVALLFCFSPILMERSFRHVQLSAQFLLLFAIYYYLRMRREGYTRLYWQFILLNVLAVGIFPYFLPMVMALLFAGLLEGGLARRKWAKHAGFLVLNVGASLLVGYCIGTIGWESAVYSRGGYGYFSMNLNAPFNPSSLGEYRWSLLLGTNPQHAGQYDGFNYLGFGVLLFLAMAALAWLCRHAVQGIRLGLKSVLQRYAVLLAVCGCLTLFAVSNIVVFHDKTLLEVPLPQFILSLCGIFRASGRLFYPVYYLLFLFVVRSIFRHASPRKAAVLLLVLVALQLADLAGVAVQKHRYFASPPMVETPLSNPVLRKAAEGRAALLLLDNSDVNHYYTALAAKYGLDTNIHDVNSGDYPGAWQAGRQAVAQLSGGVLDEKTLFMAEEETTIATLRAALEGQQVQFYEYDGYCFVFSDNT